MIKSNTTNLSKYSHVIVECNHCKSERSILLISALRNKTQEHHCKNCAAIKSAHKKPQCTKDYWTEDKVQKIKDSLKSSDKYKEAIKNRNTSGENNSMYGKTHKEETKEKMSISRTGKVQSEETIKKRSKTIKEKKDKEIQEGVRMIKSINSELRRVVNGIDNRWSFRVMERDNWLCKKCGSNEKLDAHHIKPLSKIIKELTKDISFKTELEKFNFLKGNNLILDPELKNGICLCRKCHRDVHKNWGSHNPEVITNI